MTATITREDLVAAIIAAGNAEEHARQAADLIDDEHIPGAYEAFAAAQVERDALRNRLRSDRTLLRAVNPGDSYDCANGRHDIMRGAVRLIDATAARINVTATEVAEALIAGGGTIADTIATHGTDPRLDSFGDVRGYYAFRYRLRDAVEVLTAEETERVRREREAARDAAWAARGLTRCDRCGGAGGASHWPGFTCYDCGGSGAVLAVTR